MKTEFDPTYPIHLHGIISPDEFRESINRINRAISSNKILIFLGAIFVLSMIGGMIFFIAGGITTTSFRKYGFSPLLAVGIAISTIGSMVFAFGCIVIQLRRLARMRRVVAEESARYSSRSPIPCSWRLGSTSPWSGGYYHSRRVVYHVNINDLKSILVCLKIIKVEDLSYNKAYSSSNGSGQTFLSSVFLQDKP